MGDNNAMGNDMNNNQALSAFNASDGGSGTSEQLLLEIKELTRKQVRWQRVSAAFMMAILTIVLVVVVILLPGILYTLRNIDQAANEVTESMIRVTESVDEADAAIAEIKTASQNLNELVSNNSDAITDSVSKLSEIDYEGLNKAIKDLQDAIGPVANFFNKFR